MRSKPYICIAALYITRKYARALQREIFLCAINLTRPCNLPHMLQGKKILICHKSNKYDLISRKLYPLAFRPHLRYQSKITLATRIISHGDQLSYCRAQLCETTPAVQWNVWTNIVFSKSGRLLLHPDRTLFPTYQKNSEFFIIEICASHKAWL